MSTLAEIPFQRANREAFALRDERRALNNVEFANAVSAVTEYLRARGVKRGDVVGAMLPNRLELALVMFASWRLGAAFTPVNPALTLNEAGYQLSDCKAKLVVVDANSAKLLANEALEKLDVATLPLTTDAVLAASAANESDTALLIYTSGSTGRPKGVMLDHANVAAMIRIMRKNLEFLPTDRALLVLPLFHVNALLVSLLTPLASGGSTVILEKFDWRTFWDSVVAHEATFFSAVPAIYILLNHAPPEVQPDTSRIRFVICGAAPMPAAAIAAFEARFKIPLLEGYGLTESTVGATCNPLAGPRKAGTTGQALPEMEMRIIDDTGTTLAHGAIGEVALKGPNIMRGYLNQPEATAKTVVDGWLRTGDVGFIDADGFLTLVDRKKDMIICGGENIYPKEIETALYTHDAVAECAVVGRADPVMGEDVIAFVALKPEAAADHAALARAAAQHLAKYKQPREIRVVPTLPKNPVGKIDKPALRALLKREV